LTLPKFAQAILVSPEFKEKLLEIGNGATSYGRTRKDCGRNKKDKAKIAELEKQIADIPNQKEKILKMYL